MHSLITVTQSGPQDRRPRSAPTAPHSAATRRHVIDTSLQGAADRIDESRISAREKLIVRERPEQVGKVTMPGFGLLEFNEPLEKSTIGTNAMGWESVDRCPDAIEQRIIHDPEHVCGLEAPGEDSPGDLNIHGGAHAQGNSDTLDEESVLGGDRGTDKQLAVIILNHHIEEELR